MENQEIIRQFEIQRTNLESIHTYEEFAIWTRYVIDLTNNYVPSLNSILSGLNLLLDVPLIPRNAAKPRNVTNNDHLVPKKKTKANTYINQIIEHLKNNELKKDKKSFLEKHFTLNSIATLWIATIAILITACTGGFYYYYTLGRNSSKDEMQQQFNLLSSKVIDMTKQSNILRDSTMILQTELVRCQSESNKRIK